MQQSESNQKNANLNPPYEIVQLNGSNELEGSNTDKPAFQQQRLSAQQQFAIELKKAKRQVGMIQSVWLDKQGKKEFINYGTAFAVSSRLLITCAHNIYNEDIAAVATYTIFVPNHKNQITHSTPQYKSIQSDYFRFIPLKEGENMASLPTRNQICLIALQRDIVSDYFIELGLPGPSIGDQLRVIGYPSRQYAKKVNLQSISLKRFHLKGQISSINGHIIDHTMKTKVGMSGSPLLYNDRQRRKVIAIGIHTHSGDGVTNRGVYFDRSAIQTIMDFEFSFFKLYKIPEEIRYNPRITPANSYKQTQQESEGYYQYLYIRFQQQSVALHIIQYSKQQCQQFFNRQ